MTDNKYLIQFLAFIIKFIVFSIIYLIIFQAINKLKTVLWIYKNKIYGYEVSGCIFIKKMIIL